MKGTVIYDDDIAKILKECCECSIERASFVETIHNLPEATRRRLPTNDPTVWWVDFTPIHDSTVLGPFESREQALEAEKEYLERQLKNSGGMTMADAAFS